MKKIKKITCLLLALILMLTPILETYAVATNAQQIKYNNETPVTGEGGVKISKTISPTNIENYFDITLNIQTKEIAKQEDVEIVVVMDISNSMIIYDSGDGSSRLRAAMNAGEELINELQKISQNSNSSIKIGYVAFNSHGHNIFDLQEVKTESKATTLINTMKNKTKSIVKDIDEKGDYDKEQENKYTNIEVGIKMAEDMLYCRNNNGKLTCGDDIGAKNKYIILLSDGFPTTYIKSGYTGYFNNTPEATEKNQNKDGMFYDNILKRACTIGVDYSDKGAKRAQDAATKVKNRGALIYAVGTGLTDEAKTIDDYANAYLDITDDYGRKFSTVQRTSDQYVIGNNIKDFKTWLGGTGNSTNPGIGSGYDEYYYDVTDTKSLISAYKSILTNIKETSEASWITNDPMNIKGQQVIGFLGIYDNTNKKENIATSVTKGSTSNNTASYNATTDSITWDLKNSNYSTTTVTENGKKITYYNYELKYRIRLKNEVSNFLANTSYATNDKTTLTYLIKKTGKAPELKTIEYQVPKVEGYLGTLTFNKISNYDGAPLANTSFKLVHDIDNCECKDEKDHLADNYYLEATSNSEGVVTFTKIPSGHTYKLVETATDEYHNLSQNYQVTVSYGSVTTNLTNNTIINNYKTKDLTLKKVVEGVTTSKSFTFELEASYKDAPLVGTYALVKTKNSKDETSTITFTNGKATLTLKHNETALIKDLPYKTIFTVKETNNSGFLVKYQVNDGTYTTYNVNDLSSNNLEDDIKITFINSTGNIMPATGSSGMLILAIIGSLLMIIPILYISINVFRKAD